MSPLAGYHPRLIGKIMNADLLINAVVTLFVTIDPPGLAPLFLAVTAGMNRAERSQVSLSTCLR